MSGDLTTEDRLRVPLASLPELDPVGLQVWVAHTGWGLSLIHI